MTVRHDIVLRRDRTACDRAHAEQREVVARNELPVGGRFETAVDADVEAHRRPRRQLGESASLLLAHDPVLRVSEATLEGRAATVRQQHEPLGILHRQRSPHDGVDQAEDRRVGADPKCQREGDGCREDRALPQQPQRVSDVLDQALEEEHHAALPFRRCTSD